MQKINDQLLFLYNHFYYKYYDKDEFNNKKILKNYKNILTVYVDLSYLFFDYNYKEYAYRYELMMDNQKKLYFYNFYNAFADNLSISEFLKFINQNISKINFENILEECILKIL